MEEEKKEGEKGRKARRKVGMKAGRKEEIIFW